MSSPKIIRSRRKTIALVVQPDGELLVRAPQRATIAQINAMLNKHADWVVKKQAEVLARNAQNPPRQFVEGEKFFFLGEEYPLKMVNAQKLVLRLDENFQLAQSKQGEAKALFEIWYKKEARIFFNERVAYYAKQHGFDVRNLSGGYKSYEIATGKQANEDVYQYDQVTLKDDIIKVKEISKE